MQHQSNYCNANAGLFHFSYVMFIAQNAVNNFETIDYGSQTQYSIPEPDISIYEANNP